MRDIASGGDTGRESDTGREQLLMSIILGLLGGIQTKIYIYGGLALAGLLIVLGAYRKGHAAADRANERRGIPECL